MSNEFQKSQNAKILNCYKTEGELEISKSEILDIEKGGRRAVIGEKRTFGDKEYIKTTDGWKLCTKDTRIKINEKLISGKDIIAQNKGLSSSEDGSAFIKDSDSFTQQTLPLEEINNKLTYAWYKRNDMDEDLSMINKIIDKIKSGTKLHPIVIDENNKILDGNHRLIAYKKLKYTEIPVYKRSNKDNSEK